MESRDCDSNLSDSNSRMYRSDSQCYYGSAEYVSSHTPAGSLVDEAHNSQSVCMEPCYNTSSYHTDSKPTTVYSDTESNYSDSDSVYSIGEIVQEMIVVEVKCIYFCSILF